MENLVNPAFWLGRRVFITGHTGFKGSWLSLWLQAMGAEVSGYALAPSTTPALFEVAGVAGGMRSTIGDVRDYSALAAALAAARPEIILHLAAQPLVPLSYADPVATFATNAMGTVHVLEAIRHVPGIKAAVVVSSDKCYENREQHQGYRESDPMGGHDPYSASKGCTELIVASYRRSFLAAQGIALASARAGNVIGGGDWTASRLVPDVLAAFARGEPVTLRNPGAIRPWQHVLDPLSGYLSLAERLVGEGAAFAEGWNFGPSDRDAKTVAWVVEALASAWGPDARWAATAEPQVHEAQLLKLDCSKARARLGWQPRWSAETALARSLDWYQAWQKGADMHAYTLNEIAAFGGIQ
ncbi:MAG: CDP-glucose 4,6-dehydratase [Zoogloea sp.]|uniref:CDP-glucose 4,6-dehydratase n=1 Tax=Zoogloea sp. TaxID=49181 RepID=UPI002616D492|nr:CDP-glucose 4,6-dehydratase [Zoogloea sp.]MDD3328283.1 CDP-glucose 4,6-dehydratase [Zoogloea sp.]